MLVWRSYIWEVLWYEDWLMSIDKFVATFQTLPYLRTRVERILDHWALNGSSMVIDLSVHGSWINENPTLTKDCQSKPKVHLHGKKLCLALSPQKIDKKEYGIFIGTCET